MGDEVIVIYAGCGEGHRSCAYAIKQVLKCQCCDVLNFSPFFIRKFYQRGYRLIVQKIPVVWVLLFEISKLKIARWFLSWLHFIIFRKLRRFIIHTKPKVIISTHFFPLMFLPFLKRKLPLKVVTVITDLGVHPLWINEGVDIYLVALKETKQTLINQGVPEEKIIEAGIPIRQGFYKDVDLVKIRRKFSLGEKPGLLFLSSNMGNIPFLEKIIPYIKDDFTIFIIYGENKKLKQYLERLRYPCLRIFPFYEDIWEIMRVCLAIITKPGGLTTFEAISLGKPLIFTHYIYGQEKINGDVLTKLGVGFWARSVEELRKAIYYIRNNQDTIKFSLKVGKGNDILLQILPQLLRR